MRKAEHQMDQRTDYLRELGYETRDINLRTITIWIAGLFIGGGVTAFITLGVYWLFVEQDVKNVSPGTPVVNQRKLPPPGYPRLQQLPKVEIGDFRKEEDDRVLGYAWRDKQKGVVRIPVDKAIDLVLQKGLPARGTAPQGGGAGTAPAQTEGAGISTPQNAEPNAEQPGSVQPPSTAAPPQR